MDVNGWYLWQGVAGMCYARRRIGLANVTVRGHNWRVLGKRMAQVDARERALTPAVPGRAARTRDLTPHLTRRQGA